MKIKCNYTINRLYFIIILFIGNIQWIKAIPKCPTYQQNFMKILGFRPNIFYSGSPLVRGFIENSTNAINLDCWRICNHDFDCTSYVLFLSTFECFGLTANTRSMKYLYADERYDLVSDPDAILFEKTCLKIPRECKSKLWPAVRIPGSTLVDHGYEVVRNLVTREKCVEYCLFQNEFNCLSTTFIVSHKNNLARGLPPIYDHIHQDANEIGQCTLHREDKTTRPDLFRISTTDEEYFENQCIERAPANVFCSFEQYSNSSFIYSDYAVGDVDQKECQERCTLETQFYCMGVTYTEIGWTTLCYFHSEDTISLGPRAAYPVQGSIYMRRVKCLNVTVLCGRNEITVEYQPNHWFTGRMYVNSHSEECAIEGQGHNSTVLRILVGDEKQESKCGIIRAYTKNDPFNRTLISTLVVIQKSPFIQTQGDRLIRVGCIINNEFKPDGGIPDDIALGSSIEFDRSPTPNSGSKVLNETGVFPTVIMKIIDLNNKIEIQDAQLGENLEFILDVQPANTIYDIHAINVYATSNNNETRVQLIDERGCPRDPKVFPALKKYRTRTAHGLRTRFHAFKFADAPGVKFYVQIHFCVQECQPVVCNNNTYSYGKRRKRQANVEIVNNPSTVAPIRFPVAKIKFPNNQNLIKREVELEQNTKLTSSGNQTELDESPNNIYQSVISSFTNTTESEQSAVVSETTRNNFTNFKRILRNDDNLTLNTTINVHSNNMGESESLIYGENSNRVLISGIDFEPDSSMLCVTPGIIVLILAFWLLIQVFLMTGCCILIKKYRKLAELEDDRRSLHRIHQSLDTDSLNRRVRFADQGSTFHSQVVFAAT